MLGSIRLALRAGCQTHAHDIRAEVTVPCAYPPEMTKRELTTGDKVTCQYRRGEDHPPTRSGRHIVEILDTEKSDLSERDHSRMRKVVGYPKCLLAQRPSGDVQDSAWRYSLMNWGHDPINKS
jgi:hypothetical protein